MSFSVQRRLQLTSVLRSRVAAGGGADEATYDPLIPPEKQIVTYRTKDGEIKKVTKLELQDQLQASEKLMESLNLTWEEKMAKTQAIHVEREQALEELGIMVDKDVGGDLRQSELSADGRSTCASEASVTSKPERRSAK